VTADAVARCLEKPSMTWARERHRQSLFAVPPVNHYWVRFRLVAQRGEYTSVHDVDR
jgi:hypothetical protein